MLNISEPLVNAQWGRSTRSCHRALRLSTGAAAFRVSDAAHVRVDEHSHDWPVLSLYISGAVRNLTAAGETVLCGPSAVLYGAGAEHANVVLGRLAGSCKKHLAVKKRRPPFGLSMSRECWLRITHLPRGRLPLSWGSTPVGCVRPIAQP